MPALQKISDTHINFPSLTRISLPHLRPDRSTIASAHCCTRAILYNLDISLSLRIQELFRIVLNRNFNLVTLNLHLWNWQVISDEKYIVKKVIVMYYCKLKIERIHT